MKQDFLKKEKIRASQVKEKQNERLNKGRSIQLIEKKINEAVQRHDVTISNRRQKARNEIDKMNEI